MRAANVSTGSVLSSLLLDFEDCFVDAFSKLELLFVFSSVAILAVVAADPLFSCCLLSFDVVVPVVEAEGDDEEDDDPFFLLLMLPLLLPFLKDLCCSR